MEELKNIVLAQLPEVMAIIDEHLQIAIADKRKEAAVLYARRNTISVFIEELKKREKELLLVGRSEPDVSPDSTEAKTCD